MIFVVFARMAFQVLALLVNCKGKLCGLVFKDSVSEDAYEHKSGCKAK